MKTRIGKWLGAILMIYVVAGVLLYFLQMKLLLHPKPLPQDYTYHFNTRFEERKVYHDSATMFHLIRFNPLADSIRRGVVIYFHGNMENIGHYASCVDNFTKHNYEVWMMDYPGFGKSTGTLTEEILYIEADEVYKMVRATSISADGIIVYGRSLGTGIATHLASRRNCKRVILESPYYSIANVAAYYAWMYPVDWMCKFRIPSYEYIQNIKAPITIFHGTDDGTIPYSNTEKLHPLLKPGDEVIPIEGGRHNDLNDFPLMKEKLDSLLRQ